MITERGDTRNNNVLVCRGKHGKEGLGQVLMEPLRTSIQYFSAKALDGQTY